MTCCRPGVVNIVNGYGEEAGQALATSKRIAKIAFTGSTPVGSHILKCAADNIIPSTVELGGKSPNIYFSDIMNAEPEFIDKAVEGLVLAFFNQGEVCTCPSRALIQEDMYDEFMAKVVERTRAIKRGNPLDTEVQVGAQASQEQFDKIMSYMEIGTRGRRRVADRRRQGELRCRRSTRAIYIQPTLLKGNNNMRVFQEEIFGPVVAVTTFKDEAEALAIANDTEFGLGAGVWTRDMNVAYPHGPRHPGGSRVDQLLPPVPGACRVRWLQEVRRRPRDPQDGARALPADQEPAGQLRHQSAGLLLNGQPVASDKPASRCQ